MHVKSPKLRADILFLWQKIDQRYSNTNQKSREKLAEICHKKDENVKFEENGTENATREGVITGLTFD